MSLEERISELNATVSKLVEQNEKILGIAASRAAAGSGASDTSAEKPKTTRTKKDDKKDDAGDGEKAITKSDLTTALAAWMNEFGKPAADGHPESAARHAALKTVLGKLGLEKGLKDGLAEDDQTNIDKLHNWLENTAKKADKGFGIGRLAADPAPAGDSGDDDLGV